MTSASRTIALRTPANRATRRLQARQDLREVRIFRRQRDHRARAARIAQERRQRPLQDCASTQLYVLFGKRFTEAPAHASGGHHEPIAHDNLFQAAALTGRGSSGIIVGGGVRLARHDLKERLIVRDHAQLAARTFFEGSHAILEVPYFRGQLLIPLGQVIVFDLLTCDCTL
jgi:hypothetical protein